MGRTFKGHSLSTAGGGTLSLRDVINTERWKLLTRTVVRLISYISTPSSQFSERAPRSTATGLITYNLWFDTAYHRKRSMLCTGFRSPHDCRPDALRWMCETCCCMEAKKVDDTSNTMLGGVMFRTVLIHDQWLKAWDITRMET